MRYSILLTGLLLTLLSTNHLQAHFKPPFKHVLENGLTILVQKVENNLPVAAQLWYEVGSKDEQYKGDAHLLEHLLFKGTERMSEADVFLIANKFSGNVNAMTANDFTVMLFNLPKAHWQVSIPILADCMTNCTLRQQVLNSELKTVVQELKMGRDSTERALFMALFQTIFPAYHPYHHPTIGYKHDLYKADSDRLKELYNKYYVPNNAVLVVVGNVDEQEVVKLAKEHFGPLKAKPIVRNPIPATQSAIQSQSIRLYRDIEKPILDVAFRVPGVAQAPLFIQDLLHVMLTTGKSSRLYKKLVEELKLVSSVASDNFHFMESDVFIIRTDPLQKDSIETIVTSIKQELDAILRDGPTPEEINRLKAIVTTDSHQLLEDNYGHATKLGRGYIAFKNESKIYSSLDLTQIPENITHQLQDFVLKYLRPSALFQVAALPFESQADKDVWQDMQTQSDKEDTKILSAMQRTLPLEEGKYVHQLEFIEEPLESVAIPVEEFTLNNGLKVVYHKRADSPLLYCTTYLKSANSQEAYDQDDALYLLNKLLKKSATSKHTNAELHELLTLLNFQGKNKLGLMSGYFPAENFTQVVQLLIEIASSSFLDQATLTQVINQLEIELKEARNEPSYKQASLFNTALYGPNHPLSRDPLPTIESIKNLSLDTLSKLHKQFVRPDQTTMVFVGTIPVPENSSTLQVLESLCGTWQNDTPSTTFTQLVYPEVKKPSSAVITAVSLRDQINLSYGTLSIDVQHQDYYALALYSMHLSERLFHLREETGAFYGITGEMLKNTSKKAPGSVCIATLVSPDRLLEVKTLLAHFIISDIKNFTQHDLDKAKASRRESYRRMMQTPQGATNALTYLVHEEEPFDLFDNRLKLYEKVTLEDVKRSVSALLKPEHMITVQVGRVPAEEQSRPSPVS